MSAAEREWLRLPAPSLSGERRLRLLACLAFVVFVSYLTATVAGAPSSALSTVFVVVVAPVPVMAWWAYVRVTEVLRRPFWLLAIATTLWLVGSIVWQAFYALNGNVVPRSPGVWDIFFVGAQLVAIWALVIALRSVISLRIAALDVTVIVAAGVAAAAPFVRHGLEHGATAASIVTLNRPVLSIVTLMVVVSAALGSWQGLPRSLALVGLAETALMIGNLVYSYNAVQGRYVDDRWANLAWASGAMVAMLSSSTIILRADRVIGFRSRMRIPDVPGGFRGAVYLSLAALALTLGVSSFGLVTGSPGVAIAGVAASVSIGAAMALRAREIVHSLESAYAKLDRSLAETEHAKDDLAVANEELSRANAEIRGMHVAFAELLNIADARTHGRMRELIERTGRDLAAMLEEQLDDE